MVQPVEYLQQLYLTAMAEGDPCARFVTLMTVDADGYPVSRMVTVRQFTADEIAISVNMLSPKIRQLTANDKWELAGFWPQSMTQFRLRGSYSLHCGAAEHSLWRNKPHASQIMDLYAERVRQQSTEVASRAIMQQEVAQLTSQLEQLPQLPVAEHIGLLWLQPQMIELWQQSDADRMHDRRLWCLQNGAWSESTLVP
ncbi:pyridoxamine 5'-phosphate oxidase family protein [Silvimonas sp.]|uniref:pyridoxamine 5'-phosphate oxidase family protein n=1 Tax=Silvimonas sp. TaxID=2650811 RepID=UPI002849F79E|nr:pyridoxamine 5'-phosphate oxidase family protein [Silvimonas sp.]MDR3427217.1 pyridoxamine 5'-phosphate oxidase family protein [Silvimonas sp.]